MKCVHKVHQLSLGFAVVLGFLFSRRSLRLRRCDLTCKTVNVRAGTLKFGGVVLESCKAAMFAVRVWGPSFFELSTLITTIHE